MHFKFHQIVTILSVLFVIITLLENVETGGSGSLVNLATSILRSLTRSKPKMPPQMFRKPLPPSPLKPLSLLKSRGATTATARKTFRYSNQLGALADGIGLAVDVYQILEIMQPKPKSTNESTNQPPGTIYKLKWNSCCLDGTWRTQWNVFTAFPNPDCEPENANLYWKLEGGQLKWSLQPNICLGCVGEVDDCPLAFVDCKQGSSGQRFTLGRYEHQINRATGRRYFSFFSVLHPTKCITAYSANVTVDACLFTQNHCSIYFPIDENDGEKLNLIEYENAEFCFNATTATASPPSYLNCQQNIFRLEECSGDDFQSFYSMA